MSRAVVQGQARFGHRAGDVAGERRQRVAVRQAAPVNAEQPGYCLHEFRGLGCCGQRAEIGLKEISVGHLFLRDSAEEPGRPPPA
jgi:hypothetical protein